MELQDFISTTLVQIAKGISDAAEQLKDSKALVNPRNVSTIGDKDSHIHGFLDTQEKYYKVVQKIEFDVAVTAEKGRETKSGIGIHVGSMTVGTQGKSDATNSTVSRIRFTIPMVLPMDNAPFDAEDPNYKGA